MMLHVACLPFPSPQGTQAAIDAMLRASAETGDAPHLLTYAHGIASREAPYHVHRLPDFPKVRSMRSGPSLGKIALDMRCVTQIRALCARLRPEAIVAHHIEAAFASLAADAAPTYYAAHTSLERELPHYVPSLPREPIELAARLAERFACARAAGVAAVAPSLVRLLGHRATYLPVPWPSRADGPPRRQARRTLALPEGVPICLYAGNLDRYQGWETLMAATKRLRETLPNARFLLATESDPAPAVREAEIHGVRDALDIRPLAGEPRRAMAHAAADVAWIPRRSEGGLPIKMLDAFSRSTPVVATLRATAGLPLRSVCEVVSDDDPYALARAAAQLIETPSHADDLRDRAHRYLCAEHSPGAHRRALQRMLREGAIQPTKATPTARHPQAAPARRAR